MRIGQIIKKGEDKNLTHQQIAELIHMHRSNYFKIESGQREISMNALNKVARYFGMTIDHIVYFASTVVNRNIKSSDFGKVDCSNFGNKSCSKNDGLQNGGYFSYQLDD